MSQAQFARTYGNSKRWLTQRKVCAELVCF
jgi:hypothetical protein